MSNLWNIIAMIGIELPPARVKSIAKRLDNINSVAEFGRIKSSFGPNADQQLIIRLKDEWLQSPDIRPSEIAAALLSSSITSSLYEQKSAVELVWTGPSTDMVPVRRTEQVLCEVISSAKGKLFFVSYVAYRVDLVMEALRDAVRRQVKINVLIEQPGQRVSVDSIKAIKDSVPSANIYVWESSLNGIERDQLVGSVHAKCAVADEEIALITSANLTEAAMERNMELGVLIRGGTLPSKLAQHLDALIATGIVKKV